MSKTILSDKINALENSPTIGMAQKSRELQAQGIDIISLSVGEPDFDTPEHIKEAGIKAIKENYSHYTPVAGYKVLLEAISLKLKRDNDLDYNTNQIVVSCGAKHSLYNIFQCIINPNDEVIIPCPYWVSYSEIVKLAGGVPVFVETGMEDGFKITPSQLKEKINDKTKALFLNSPSNPTGSIYSKQELEEIAKVVADYPNCMIVSDEIYEYITYEGTHESIAQFDFIKDQVVVVNGMSKGYAMTGWRIGYMAGPEWLAKAVSKLQSQLTSGVTSIAQMASIAGLTGTDEPIVKMRNKFKERRDLAVKLMKEIPGFEIETPKAAFYLFPKVNQLFGKTYEDKTINNATDFSLFLLEHARVATVTGEAFGAPDYIRLSYATSNEMIEEALKRIKEAVALLK
ncbi:aspartate aminotransferase [Balneicella halophila]|uniref:Aminotransferase n=1 Tax=Balneicella halophila TaxID=1537566 RepID=A0A7L4UQJ5_BALHA|nr:pyridoxal phosphate-dependent aminotransferase [Balneicella halophila]PVX50010.1 aspartate aminotransferase [Balneicella halophila]